MKREKIETGKIVGTHGVRGALRVQPWCDTPEFLCRFKSLFLKENAGFKTVKVKSSRPHGNIVIMEIDGISTVEQAEALRGQILFLNRKDLSLDDDQYLICELIGCEVFDADSNALLGKITDVSKTGANDVWHIMRDGKEFLIPAIESVVVLVNIDDAKVVIRPLAGIFD